MFEKDKTTVIAEMANAHEGELSTAKSIVDCVEDSADAIKFQIFTADDLALPSHPDYESFSSLEMGKNSWEELISYASESGLMVFADVFGYQTIESLNNKKEIKAFKIHTSDVSNKPLIKKVSGLNSPIILSAGGSNWLELSEAIEAVDDVPISLMYGFQNYPTELPRSNLYKIQRFIEKFNKPVGYASHVDGDLQMAKELPSLAVAAGASAVEVHITIDRSEKGTDYYSSLEQHEFNQMVKKVRSVENVVGQRDLSLTEKEKEYRKGHKKWLVATKEIAKGQVLTQDNVGYKRVANPDDSGVTNIEDVLGKKVIKNISTGEIIGNQHMNMKVVATLACRLESTRLYGKPLQQIGDDPIITHLIRRLRSCSRIDEIALAIADTPSKDAFVQYAKEKDIQYTIGSEEDVLKRLIDTGEDHSADVVVRITTENPFVYYQNIDSLIDEHIEENADLTTTKKLPRGTAAEVISMESLRKSHKHGEDRHRSEFCSLFIVENPDIFNIQVSEPPQAIKRPDIRLTVDNPSDLILARKIWDKLEDSDSLVKLRDIVDLLDNSPDLMEINSHLPDGTNDELAEIRPFMYGDG